MKIKEIKEIYIDKKSGVTPKVLSVGNRGESGVVDLHFNFEVKGDGFYYLVITVLGVSRPYPIKNDSIPVDYAITKYSSVKANVILSTSEITTDLLKDVVWISDTFTLSTRGNDINIEDLKEQELEAPLKIVYDDLLALKQEIETKLANGDFVGPKGEDGLLFILKIKEMLICQQKQVQLLI